MQCLGSGSSCTVSTLSRTSSRASWVLPSAMLPCTARITNLSLLPPRTARLAASTPPIFCLGPEAIWPTPTPPTANTAPCPTPTSSSALSVSAMETDGEILASCGSFVCSTSASPCYSTGLRESPKLRRVWRSRRRSAD